MDTNIRKSSETSDLSGHKILKSDILIHFMGTADELNAHLGLIKAMISNEDAWQVSWHQSVNFLEKVQKNVMKIMSHVSDTENPKYHFNYSDVADLEREIKRLMDALPKQRTFSVPGKNIIEAQVQITRTVARRTERMFVSANGSHPLNEFAGVYLNKLSDYLFFLSQQESLINVNFINQITGI